MADKQSYDDFISSLKDQLEKEGLVIDNADALKDAYEASATGLSFEEVKKFTKNKEEEKEPEKPKDADEKDSSDPTVINEFSSENSENPDNANGDEWKDALRAEWKKWAEDNKKIYDEFTDPDKAGSYSFHLYENEEKKKDNVYEAEISYASKNNLVAKGYEGAVPPANIMKKIVELAQKNGPKIELGPNMSSAFAAQLMVACYETPGMIITNPPSKEDFEKWPKELQDKVNKAKAEADKRDGKQPKDKPKDEEKKKSYTDIWNEVATHKMNEPGTEFDLGGITDNEQKAMYFAAATLSGIKLKNSPKVEDLKAIKNKDIQFRLKEAQTYKRNVDALQYGATSGKPQEVVISNFQEPWKKALWTMAALDCGATIKDAMSAEEIQKLPENLKLPLMRKQREAKVAELRKRGASQHGNDEKAFQDSRGEERTKRAEKTMSDEAKYEREVEMEADGKTPKKDDQTGKPVYKKNDKGEFVYKTDDKGNKVETAGYQAFKKRLAGYGKSK